MKNRREETAELWPALVILTLIASILPQILFRTWTGTVPAVLPYVKLVIFLIAGITFWKRRQVAFTRYIIILSVIILTEMMSRWIYSSTLWQASWDTSSFIGNFGGSILLKVLAAVPVVIVLLVMFRTPDAVYLTRGNLTVKADEIRWLGIRKAQITWGRLAVISALCISLGTALLTLLTVTGVHVNLNTGALIRYFPLVILLAIVNSLCEGIMYRSAVLGSLRHALPKKQLMLLAAAYFGIAHYYGAPSGVVGVFMSGLLGWFMCRSMYETRGFVSSWLIHCMQDVVIFATIVLLGGFR